MTALVTRNLPLVSGAPNGIAKLRELILELAVRGKLVSQDVSDEPASLLLVRISAEKSLLAKQVKPVGSVSAAERRHALPHGWSWARLGSLVLESGAGWSPNCEPRPREGDEWGVLKVSAVSWAEYRPEENKALPAHLDPRPEHEVQTGDFLVSRANTADLVARSVVVESTPRRLMLSDKIVRLKLAQSCNRRFVNLANSCPDARRYYGAIAGGTSSSMKNVSREQILNLPVPVPPVSEQHRIVAKVDELMALCDRLGAEQADAEATHVKLVEALLASLTQAHDAADFRASWQQLAEHFHALFTTEASVDALKQTVLQLGIMGRLTATSASSGVEKPASPCAEVAFEIPDEWRWCSFGECWESSFYGPRFGKGDYVSAGGVPTIRTTDMSSDGLIHLKSPPEVVLSEEQLQTYGLKKGDLLVTRSGSIGTMALFMLEMDAIPSAYLIRIRFLPTLLPRFGLIYLRSPMGQRLLGLNTTSVGVPNVNATKMATFPLALPPLEIQQQIVEKVEELLALCDQLNLHISQARQQHECLASVLVEQAIA